MTTNLPVVVGYTTAALVIIFLFGYSLGQPLDPIYQCDPTTIGKIPDLKSFSFPIQMMTPSLVDSSTIYFVSDKSSQLFKFHTVSGQTQLVGNFGINSNSQSNLVVAKQHDSISDEVFMSHTNAITKLSTHSGQLQVYNVGSILDFVVYGESLMMVNGSYEILVFDMNESTLRIVPMNDSLTEIELLNDDLIVASQNRITILSALDYSYKKSITQSITSYSVSFRLSVLHDGSEYSFYFIVNVGNKFIVFECKESDDGCINFQVVRYPSIQAPNDTPEILYLSNPCMVKLSDKTFFCGDSNVTKVENGLTQSFLTIGGSAIEGQSILDFTFTQINSMAIVKRSANSPNELLVNDFEFMRVVSLEEKTVRTLSYDKKCSSSQRSFGSTNQIFFQNGSMLLVNQDSLSIFKFGDSNEFCDIVHYSSSFQISDSIPANISIIYHPTGIFKYKSDIYFCDSRNNRIRKIDENGMVVNIAGNGYAAYQGSTLGVLASVAQFNNPNGIVVTENGIYISDSGNNCVRWISEGKVFDFAGECSGKEDSTFKSPYGLSFNATHLFVADSLNHRIAAVHFTTREISNVVGTVGIVGDRSYPPNFLFNSPSGIHVNGNYLFIADTNNHKIKRFNIITGALETYYGDNSSNNMFASQHTLSYPYAVLGNENNLIIADTYNSRIISANGVNGRGVYFGTGEAGWNGDSPNMGNKFFNPKGLFMDNNNAIYFSDSGNNRLRTLSLDSRFLRFSTSTLAGGIGDGGLAMNSLAKVSGVISNSKGEIFIADYYNHLIRKIDGNGVISTIIGKGYGFNGHHVRAEDVLLSYPSNMAISSQNENDFYFCDSGNRLVRKYSDGYITTVAGGGLSYGDRVKATESLLSYPISLFVSKSEDIFFADYFSLTNYVIRKVSNRDGTISTVVNDTSSAFTVDTDTGILYASKNNYIHQYNPVCPLGYKLDENHSLCLPVCFGISSSERNVCSGNGVCIAPNVCSCYGANSYVGEDCKYPVCSEIESTNPQVCNKQGTCVAPNKCACNDGYVGWNCERPVCFGKSANSSCGGAGKGVCISKDQCLCTPKKYSGTECEYFICYGKTSNDPTVCGGVGRCTEPDNCECETDYYGDKCDKKDYSTIIMATSLGSVFLLVLFIATITGILVFIFTKYRRQKKIIDTDIQLDQRLLLPDDMNIYLTDHSVTTSSGGLSLDEKEESFFIPLQDLNMDKTIKRLGTGGMGSVLKTTWKNFTVAVKVFDLNNFNISESDFIREATILSKLRHPNIITFYGISSSPSKRYIVMECMDGSLESFLNDLQNQTVKCSIRDKLNLILQICYGISYLHNLQPNYIVHRDLKPANVLLQNNYSICKLCDFGLGRVLSTHTFSSLTSAIGTCYYMSPEMSMPGEVERTDAKGIDIYSLAIIMYQMLFEVKDPYTSTQERILRKLRLDKPIYFTSQIQLHKSICENHLRPIIPFTDLQSCQEWCKEFDEEDNSMIMWALSQLISKCWDHFPYKRPKVEEIIHELECYA